MEERKSREGKGCCVRAVLFDFGGVLADEGFKEGLRVMAAADGLDAEAFIRSGFELIYETGYVLGKGEEKTFWKALRDRTGVQGRDKELREVILSRFRLRPWMIGLLPGLRQAGIVLGILSDQTQWLDELNDRYDFFHNFDYIFNSYYLGKGKKEPTLFADVASRLDLPAGEILFIDDHPGNIERAAEAGFHTLLYRDPEGFLKGLARFCPVND